MKKYMVAENIELLKEFGISQLESTINHRCDRIFCSDCGAVSEMEKPCSCKKDELKGKKTYHSMETGGNVIFKDSDRIHVEKDGEDSVLFYYEVIATVIMETGSVKFSKSPVRFMRVKDSSFTIEGGYGVSDVSIKNIQETLQANSIECDRLTNLIDLCMICGYHSWSILNKYTKMIDTYGHKLFESKEFVKDHIELVRNVINRSYGNGSIDSIRGMCDYFEVPMCLKEYTKDAYFRKLDGYSDIRVLDAHPVEIQGCFAYYIGSGKFNRRTIKAYLDVFDAEYWDSRDKINYFLSYVKKNLWMGDSVFTKALAAFKYAEEKKVGVSEDTINSKFQFGMKNVDRFAEQFGTAEADEFHQIRENQGIIPALKQLLVWTNKSEEA